MRAPVMVKKKDRMPNYYPVFEDLATPLGLVSRLDPNAKIVRLVGKTRSIRKIKDKSSEWKCTDGYGSMRRVLEKGFKAEYVLDCLSKKGGHIEQEYKAQDLAEEVLCSEIPELVIKHVDYLRPAAKSCEICDVNGIESLLMSHENRDPGPIETMNGKPITHAQYFLDLLKKNHCSGIYPEDDIRTHMKAVLHTVALKGYDGKALVPANDFIPVSHAHNTVESIITPWAKERWWTTIRRPANHCAPFWQSTLTGDFRGRAVA
jgi:hypothetical protein